MMSSKSHSIEELVSPADTRPIRAWQPPLPHVHTARFTRCRKLG